MKKTLLPLPFAALSYLCLILYSIPFTLVMTKELFVDARLESQSENSYPNLEQAHSGLVDDGNNLIDKENTIILKSSCLGTTQYWNTTLINATLRGGGSISIVYENATDQIPRCEDLPTLLLSVQSWIFFSPLDSLNITGLNIHLLGAGDSVFIWNSLNLFTISNFCLNHSQHLTYSSPFQFLLENVSTVSMKNGVYIHDGNIQFSFREVSEVILENIVFHIVLSNEDSGLTALLIGNDGSMNASLAATNLQVTCDPGILFAPQLIRTDSITNVSVSSLSVVDCNFSQPLFKNFYVFGVVRGTNLHVQEITIRDVSIGQYLSNACFFWISDVESSTLSHFIIKGLHLDGNLAVNSHFLGWDSQSGGTLGKNYPMYANLSHWIITDSSMAAGNLINCVFVQFIHFGGLNMVNFLIERTQLRWYSAIFQIKLPAALTDSVETKLVYFKINNLNITNNDIKDSATITVQTGQLHFWTTIEPVHLEVTDLNFVNNTCWGSSLLSVSGILTSISNVTVLKNRMAYESFFFVSTSTATLLMSNWFVNDLTMEITSVFVSVNYTFDGQNIGLSMLTSNGVYAETKPLVIYNSTFSNITLLSNSILFLSMNSMAVIQQNDFNTIILNNSVLFELGNDPYLLLRAMYFQNSTTNTHTEFIMTQNLTVFTAAEDLIFQDSQDLKEVYQNAREEISRLDPGNAIYFISVEKNLFSFIETINCDNLITFRNFEITNGSIAVLNNVFSNISSDDNLNLIECNSISRGIFAYNHFVSSSLFGYAISLATPVSERLIFEGNMILTTNQLGLYSIKSDKCSILIIKNCYATDFTAMQTFIDISCGVAYNDVILQDSVFEDFVQTNPSESFASLNFISLLITKGSSTSLNKPRITIHNNSFINCKVLNSKAYSYSMYQSTLITILSIEVETHFISNTFDRIAALPMGSIISISQPKIFFKDCVFQDFLFESASGAINLIFETLSIGGCTFISGQSLARNGAGLFKFTNFDPEATILEIDIQDSIFRNNTSPSGAVLSVQNNSMRLNITACEFSNNQLTDLGGMIQISNISMANITFSNSNFSLYKSSIASHSPQTMIKFVNSESGIFFWMSNLKINVTGPVKGYFLSTSGQQPIVIWGAGIIFSGDSEHASSSQFGIFEGSNFEAEFKRLQIRNVSLEKTALFQINAETAGAQDTAKWKLTIFETVFENLILSEALILINSNADGNSFDPLDDLSIIIEEVSVTNVQWLSSSNGIVRSATPLLGRKSAQNDFAINIINSNFTKLTGTTGLIINAVEPMFDSVAVVKNCQFSSINASGSGSVFNFFRVLLSTFETHIKPNSKRNPTIVLTSNRFEEISAQSGALIYWESNTRGCFLSLEGNTFTNIRAAGQGGVIFARYTLKDLPLNATPELCLKVISENDLFDGVIAQGDGGVISVLGTLNLVNLSFENLTLREIKTFKNGGFAYLNSLFFEKETQSRLLDNSQAQIGTMVVVNDHMSNISAINGGLIYEESSNGDEFALIFDSNIVEKVSASSRGGAFYVTDRILSIKANTFDDVSASLDGNIIYSVSGHQNSFMNLSVSNLIVPSSVSLVSFAPTNLEINFVSLHDDEEKSPIKIAYDDDMAASLSIPVALNMTSYSLSEYLMTFTLIYNGSQGSQIVHDDDSTQTQISLTFILQKEDNPQNFVSRNCSNSTCSVSASTVILRGLAGDLILVNAIYVSEMYNQSQKFYIRIRGCLPGERNNTLTRECIYCSIGTYSLFPNETKCSDCPVGALCNGGSNITIQQGYYRSAASLTSLNIIKCDDSDSRCLKGDNFNTCSKPYSGPACLQCNTENGFVMSGKYGNNCTQCHSKSTLIVLAVLHFIASICYQIFMAVAAFKENKRIHQKYQENQIQECIRPTQFMIILTVYTQILFVLVGLENSFLSSLINVSSIVGNPHTEVTFSLQCLYLLNTPTDLFKAFKFEVMIYVFSPLVKILVVVLLELLRNLIWKDPKRRGRKKSLVRIGSVTVVLIILEQPGIIGILCQYLSCSKLDPLIEEYYYIKTRNSIQCHTDEYNSFARAVVIPGLVFWALIVPFGIFAVLHRSRKKLFASKSLRIALGNFYNSYSKDSYYWGVFIILLKVAIYVLYSVINATRGEKGIMLLLIIYFYYFLLLKRQPYTHKSLMSADKYCSVAYLAALILIILKLLTEKDKVKLACSILIAIIIIFAGVHVLSNILWLYIQRAVDVVKQMIRRKQDKKILLETLEHLKFYHHEHPLRKDKNHRRSAICVTNLPQRLRNTEDYEQELKAKKKQEVMIQLGELKRTSFFQRFLKIVTALRTARLPEKVNERQRESLSTNENLHVGKSSKKKVLTNSGQTRGNLEKGEEKEVLPELQIKNEICLFSDKDALVDLGKPIKNSLEIDTDGLGTRRMKKIPLNKMFSNPIDLS